jgi:cation:H+ antiporter
VRQKEVHTTLVAAGWLVGLGTALYASEKLVHYFDELGAEIHIPLGLLGFLVALGADGPEVTSALIAVTRGSGDVGLGIIFGSNIYNLAGLLGISGVIAGRIAVERHWLTVDAGTNGLITVALVALVLLSALHVFLGAFMLVVLAAYVVVVSDADGHILGRLTGPLHRARRETEPPELPPATEPGHPIWVTVLLLAVCVVFIVAGSDLLVNTSLTLGTTFGLPHAILGTLILAVATSLPNTWAAISLTRRGMGAAAVAATFSSNSINGALGAGLPSLVTTLHASVVAGSLGAFWLAGMTALIIALFIPSCTLTRPRALAIIAGYVSFVAAYLIAAG